MTNRFLVVGGLLLAALSGLPLLSTGALSQSKPADAAETAEDTTEEALSREDMSAAPFPPGRYAGVVKQVCTECHMGQVVTDLRYNHEEAVRYYKVMVGSDVESEQAKQVIEYLSTTLGR
ncbi:hypothetical protein [Devosia naphthalenivorans]|uniref:hypothetical protein n=1 Tax=Devosia naphthalenivorans TaxID=2082392 RepID=UPI000D3426D0|nr:hypothetical protein [Devosia naphthalenivorans]